MSFVEFSVVGFIPSFRLCECASMWNLAPISGGEFRLLRLVKVFPHLDWSPVCKLINESLSCIVCREPNSLLPFVKLEPVESIVEGLG